MTGSLGVWYGERRVGALLRQRSGGIRFTYAASWLEDPAGFAISVSLPLEASPSHPPAAHAFFANLLPEGRVREAVARQLGLSVDNDFAILEAIGGECAGALAVLPAEAHPAGGPSTYAPLPPEAIAAMARRASVLAEVSGGRGTRLSLAGAQDKLPVRRDPDGALWLPLDGAPSTHVLKIPSREYKQLPANEVLLTRVARAVALETIEADLVRLDGVESAVMRRYDRVVRDAGITRLHQEDLCQALGRLPATKYEQEGGPSFVEAMGIVRQHSSEPLVDAGQLLRWLLFGLLVGNADGHGKNLSLLHTEGGGLRLAPFYDLVCTRVYPRLDRRLAMSIGGMRDPGLIGRRHLESLADVTGIGRRLVLREAEGLATRLPDAFEEAAEAHLVAHGKTPIVERIRSAIRAQCRRTRSLLDQ